MSLEQSYDDRLDDSNLITLCRDHHEMAERGELSIDNLKSIAKANSEAR